MNPNHTCHVCGWRVTQQWVEHLADLARFALLPGQRLQAVVVRCEECPQKPTPTVVHHVFRPGIDFWLP